MVFVAMYVAKARQTRVKLTGFGFETETDPNRDLPSRCLTTLTPKIDAGKMQHESALWLGWAWQLRPEAGRRRAAPGALASLLQQGSPA
jgi:hypothetical protein